MQRGHASRPTVDWAGFTCHYMYRASRQRASARGALVPPSAGGYRDINYNLLFQSPSVRGAMGRVIVEVQIIVGGVRLPQGQEEDARRVPHRPRRLWVMERNNALTLRRRKLNLRADADTAPITAAHAYVRIEASNCKIS